LERLVDVRTEGDIFEEYRATPLGDLLRYHNLEAPFRRHETAAVLVGMCMDNRKQLHIPENFAFILRTGGANLRQSEFKVSYAIAVGGIRHIALIAHTQCGMVNLTARREQFVRGLVETAGWEEEWASQHFDHNAPLFEIGNELDFVLSETRRIRTRYAGVVIAPMMYRVEDNRLYLVREDEGIRDR
jgi:carbonic anhydrase